MATPPPSTSIDTEAINPVRAFFLQWKGLSLAIRSACAFAVLFLLACALTSWLLSSLLTEGSRAYASLETRQKQIAEVQEKFAQVERQRAGQALSLPSRTQAKNLTRDIGRWAEKLNVQVSRISLGHTLTTPAQQGYVQVELTFSGGYASTKQLLGSLMDRHETLAIKLLNVQAKPGDPYRQTWDLLLNLYVRD